MRTKSLPFFLAFLLSIAICTALHAQIPKLLSYQGILTDTDGKAVVDGNYSVTVHLFDVDQGGTPLWSETQNVSTTKGLFSILLGQVTGLDLPFDELYYVETVFQGETLSPRSPLTSSPYALNSQSTVGLKPYALDNVDGTVEDVVFVNANSDVSINGNIFMRNDASILGLDGLWGFNDLRFFGNIAGAENGEDMIITPDGNVGIGRTTNLEPASILTVGNDEEALKFYPAQRAGVEDLDAFTLDMDGEKTLVVWDDLVVTNQMSINSPNSPPDGIELFVNGDILMGPDADIYSLDMLVGADDLRLFGNPPGQDEPEDVWIGPDGKVTIGTATNGITPLAKFQVNGENGTALMFQNNEIKLTNSGGTNFSFVNDGVLRLKNTSSAEAAGTPGDDLLTVSASGDVVIGPAVNFFSKFSAADDYRGFFIPKWEGGLASPDSIVIAGVFEGNGSTRPNVRFTKKEQASNFYDIGFNGEDNFVMASSGAGTSFVLTQGGDFGLGVLNPSEKLEVSGNILASGTITENSDRRFKENFSQIDGALNKIQQLSGLYYDWKVEAFPEKQFTQDRQIGLIAQEVEALFPEMVRTDNQGYKSVNYGRMTPVLIEAIKEQQDEISQLKAEKVALEARLEQLESKVMARLDALEGKSAKQEFSTAAKDEK